MTAGVELGVLLAGVDHSRLCDADVVAVAVARARQVAHLQALLMTDLVAIADRCARMETLPEWVRGRRPVGVAQTEIAVAMRWTQVAAGRQLHLAQTLVRGLPMLHAAMLRGDVDWAKAKICADAVAPLSLAAAAAVLSRVLPDAVRYTAGQLRARLAREVVIADPAAARRRYQAGVRARRVERGVEHDGTATLSGRSLPIDRAAAADAHIQAIARTLKHQGDPRTMDQIRADILLDLLQGLPIPHHPTRQPEHADPTTTQPDQPERIDPQTGQPHQPARAERAEQPNQPKQADQPQRPERAGPELGQPHHAEQAGPGTGQPDQRQHQTERVGPERTSQRPTQPDQPPHQTEQAEQARRPDQPQRPERAGPEASQPDQRPHHTERPLDQGNRVDHPPGRPDRHPTRRSDQHPPKRPRGGCPTCGRHPIAQTLELTAPITTLLGLSAHPGQLGGWAPVLAEITRALARDLLHAPWRVSLTNDHGHVIWHGPIRTRPHPNPHRRHPTPRDAAFIRARDRTCRFPGCRHPAIHTQIDHTQPHSHAGPTTPTNLDCLCLYHHTLKTAGLWTAHQHPQHPTITWTSHLRQTHTTHPEPLTEA